MKTLKWILPMLAFVVAIGLAFASAEKPNDALANEYIQQPGNCQQVVSQGCITSPGVLCTYFGQQVYGVKNSLTQCSIQLYRPE